VSLSLKARAIVLGTVDYGETDRVVTLLTEERGKLSAFARGARVSRKRFGGALEPFTLLHAELKERRGSDLLFLETVSVERGFGAVRTELARIACASYACELARELIRDSEQHADLFDLLARYLGRLDAGPAQPTALRAYELAALRAAGLMPMLDACARCGNAAEPWSDGEVLRLAFDPEAGGVLCRDCSGSASPGVMQTRAETAQGLCKLQSGLDAADAAPLGAAVASEARHLLARFVEHQLGRRLKSRVFLDEMASVLA
jgi:DNA repair protein RecO (recombination protein O)